MPTATVVINMDRRCSKCGKGGATQSGLCLKCAGDIALRRLKEKKGMPTLRRYTTTLDCELKDHEILAYGRELAQVTSEAESEESRQASIKKEMAAKLAGLEARRTEISAKVNRGRELRDVQVEVTADFTAGTATETRLDTGEIVRERPLRDEEKQAELPKANGGV